MNKHLKSALGIGFFVVAMGAVYYSYNNSDPFEPPPPPPTPATPADLQARREERERRTAERRAREAAENEENFKKDVARRTEVEAEVIKAFEQPGRWKMLPTEVVDEVNQDANGNIWLKSDDLGVDSGDHRERHFKLSVESFANGSQPMIYGGKLLLKDKRGRVWANSDRYRGVLHCYDPATRQWSSRSTRGEANIPTTQPLNIDRYGEFTKLAWEDEAGNVSFFGGSKDHGYGVHRMSAGGEWIYEQLLNPRTTEHYLLDRPKVAQQTGGRVLLYPKNPDRYSRDKLKPFYFDGSKWKQIQPFHCRNEDHDIDAIIPMHNGAIGSLCDGDAFWMYWPEGLVPQVSIVELVTKLDDSDPIVRQGAVSALIDLGPDKIEQIKSLEGELVSAGGRKQLAAVVQHLASVTTDDHDGVIHGGRFIIDQIYYLSQSRTGQLRFYTDDCVDLATNETLEDCLLTVDADGKWTNQPLKQDDLMKAGMGKIPDEEFEDSRGSIWLAAGRRMSPVDGSVESAVPDGLTVGEPVAEDSSGRIYFESTRLGRSYVVFDPGATDAAPLLPQVVHHAIDPVHMDSERQGWALNGLARPFQIFRFGAKGGVEPLSVPWDEHIGIAYLMPLKNGVYVATYNSNNSFYLWDGQQWTFGKGSFREAVHANAARLSELVGHDFKGYGQYREDPRNHLASDGRGGLWFVSRNYERTDKVINNEFFEQVYFHRFEYFDGKQWHDVWKEVGWEMPGNGSIDRPVCAVEGGDTVLYSCRPPNAEMSDRVLYRFRFNRAAGKVEVERIGSTTEPMEVKGNPQAAKDPSRESWISWHKYMLHFFDGQVEALAQSSYPRLNSVASSVRKHLQLLETTDGRIFQVNNNGIFEVAVTDEDQQLKITEIAKFPWPTPRNAVRAFFIDDGNGLWMDGSGNQIVRVQLPPKGQAGQ